MPSDGSRSQECTGSSGSQVSALVLVASIGDVGSAAGRGAGEEARDNARNVLHERKPMANDPAIYMAQRTQGEETACVKRIRRSEMIVDGFRARRADASGSIGLRVASVAQSGPTIDPQ